MNRDRCSWCALLVAVVLTAVILTVRDGISEAVAQTGDAKVETLRPEVSKPVQAAKDFISARNFPEALLAIRVAEGIADRTPYENYLIERVRAVAAFGAGDTPTATRSFEAIIASGRLPPAEQVRMVETLAGMYFKAADYPNAVTWASRYLKDGGANPQVRMLLVRSLYFTDDFAGAATQLRAILDGTETTGAAPSQEDLQLLASCYTKLNDGPGYAFALDKLLAYYPKKDYWADAIRRAETKPGFADILALDVLRLLQATGNLTTAAQYTAMAQLALKVGYPAEAKRVIDQGFAAGVLGTGADADLQRRLRDTSTKQATEDEKLLGQNAKDAAAAKDGTPLVNVGFALVTAGQFDKGLMLMEQGIQKGAVKRPDDAKLHLAIAYLTAGQKAKAIQTFKTVQGSDGTADLARLWLIHAQRSSS
jgi:hypothetical protein